MRMDGGIQESSIVDPAACALARFAPPRRRSEHAQFRNEHDASAVGASAASIPFSDLLLPFIEPAIDAACEPSRWCTGRARASLRDVLIARLSRVLASTLDRELEITRSVRSATRRANDRRNAYDAFADAFRARGWTGLVERAPEAARAGEQAITHWSSAMAELRTRLERDRSALSEWLHDDRVLGPVVDVRSDLSDPHADGRTVCALDFERGLTVYYKPRSLAADAAFVAFVRWLRARDARCDLMVPTILDRGTYGWMEACKTVPLDPGVAAARFFDRAGQLACIAYALGVFDLHTDNLLRVGDQPVIVDLETLLCAPSRTMNADGTRQTETGDSVPDSVLRTLLLPTWCRMPDGHATAIGGLSDLARDDASYLPHLLAGFSRTYLTLVRHRAEVLDPSGPLSRFDGAAVRVVFRSTPLYATVLERRDRAPRRAFSAGRAQDIRVLLQATEPGVPAAVVDTEVAALVRDDIPAFYVDAAGVDIVESGGAMVGPLRARSGLTEARERIARFGNRDLRIQRHVMLVADQVFRHGTEERRRHTDEAPAGLDDIHAVEHASAIARLLTSTALRDAHGIGWVGAASDRNGAAERPSVLGCSSFGNAGVALFLAAHAAVTGDVLSRETAMGALRPLQRRGESRRSNARQQLDEVGLGAAAGAIYSLVRASDYARDSSLLDSALRLAPTLHARARAVTRGLDVAQGLAGAVLGLAALVRATRDRDTLRQLADLAARLRRSADASWSAGHHVPASMRASGFAHGASGIAQALLVAHRLIGDNRLRDVAMQLLDSCRSACTLEGTVGIGLAWASAVRSAPDDRSRAYTSAVLTRIVAELLEADTRRTDDSLCAGLGARGELLLVAAESLGDPSLRERARAEAAAAVQRARRGAGHRLGVHAALAPGLTRGHAGIGYWMLRLVHPDRIRCVLLCD
jgi:lantibiotic modifying enzyme